jgi:hypothetical protein
MNIPSAIIRSQHGKIESCEISQALHLLCWNGDIPNRREPCEQHLSAAAAGVIA